jgi:hypothetical protein
VVNADVDRATTGANEAVVGGSRLIDIAHIAVSGIFILRYIVRR